MKLRSKFLYFVIVLHLVLTVLAYFLLAYNKFLFFGMQLLVLISAIVSYRLYRDFVKPLEILAAGVESIRDRDFSCTLIKTGNDELDCLIDVYNRMIEQLRKERLTRQEQHYFLERLINAASIGVVVLDLDEKISLLNPVAEKILGEVSAIAVGQALKNIARGPLECLYDLKPGDSRVVRIDGIRVYRCHKSQFLDHGFHRQFLLLEELTEEIVETQKKAYEKVIRAMSHEVNNSVGAINSILNSILDYKMQLTERDRRDYQEGISVAIERNSGLGRFMANYADVVRIPPPHKIRYDLHNLLKSIHALMQKDCFERNIEWRFELSDDILEIEMDVNQMEQALINIVKNAIEAIGRNGSIVIRSSEWPRMLRVIDTGRGLDAETAHNLFTPFYTTKKDGQGIGLTLIREILMNHGFGFNLKMNAENKTEFQIIFEQQKALPKSGTN
jgi:nitrogen fixation/metabolism regulation signal transduction histidine kinase